MIPCLNDDDDDDDDECQVKWTVFSNLKRRNKINKMKNFYNFFHILAAHSDWLCSRFARGYVTV